MTLKKFLVYEAFRPPYAHPMWQAVEADGLHGLIVGIAPESRIYSWWAEDSISAIALVGKHLGAPIPISPESFRPSAEG